MLQQYICNICLNIARMSQNIASIFYFSGRYYYNIVIFQDNIAATLL